MVEAIMSLFSPVLANDSSNENEGDPKGASLRYTALASRLRGCELSEHDHLQNPS